MEIVREGNDIEVVLIIKDAIDTFTAPELEEYIKKNCSNAKSISFDLSNVDYISSAGLRTILLAHRAMKMNGGNIKVISASEPVKEVFELTNFNDLIGNN